MTAVSVLMRFCLLGCVALFLGCSDDGEGPADTDAQPQQIDAMNGTDAPPAPIDAPPNTPDAGPVICNMLTNDAPEITVRRSTSPLPTPTGGPIVDGTYYLISDVFHEAAMDMDLGPEQATAEYSGESVQQIVSVMGEEPIASSSTFVLTPDTGITFTQNCPDALDLRWDQYSSDGIILELHYTGVKRVQTYELQ